MNQLLCFLCLGLHMASSQDLFSALVKGPTRTPYEDGLYLFDIQLPNIYPAVPPLFRYLSQCSGRLNPNLYDNGKVCVSLLGTWIGKVMLHHCSNSGPLVRRWGWHTVLHIEDTATMSCSDRHFKRTVCSSGL